MKAKKKLQQDTYDKLDQVTAFYNAGQLSEAKNKLFEILEINQINPDSNDINHLEYEQSRSIAITFSSLGIIASNEGYGEEAIKFYTKSINYYNQALSKLAKKEKLAKKDAEYDISGIAYNISVIYQNLKIAEKENDNEYDSEKVKIYTIRERENLINASFNLTNVNEELSNEMRHRLATIYYNLGKNYESDNDLDNSLDYSLNKAMRYYELSLGFANNVSQDYMPAADVFTIEDTKTDIRKALKGIKNLLNDHSEELEEKSSDDASKKSTRDTTKTKKASSKRKSSKAEIRNIVAINRDITDGLAKLSQFAEDIKENPTESTLWRHQQQCIIDTSQILNTGEKSGYVNMATGTGKTKVFTNLVKAMGVETIIVAPTTILVKQAAQEIKKMAPYLDVGTIDGSCKRKGSNVTVITYASFERMYNLDVFKDVNLIILDEVHSSLSEKRVNAIKSFQEFPSSDQDSSVIPIESMEVITSSLQAASSSSIASEEKEEELDKKRSRSNYPVIIGFTATDRFNSTRKKGSFTNVSELLPNRLFEYSIAHGMDEKVLHPCKIVELQLDDKINQDFARLIRQKNKKKNKDASSEINATDLELLKADEINRVLPDLIANIRDPENGESFRNKPGLVFAIDISHAESVKDEINKALGEGYAASIHSKMSKKEQEEILEKHKSGEIKILVNVDMLTVGYDDKKLEYIIDFRPTKSSVRLIQTFGRITRKDSNNIDAKVYIQLIIPDMNMKASDLFDGRTRLGEIRPAEEAHSMLETAQEISIEKHCYYKVKFPNGGPEIERAIENKDTIEVNPKRRKKTHVSSSSSVMESSVSNYQEFDLDELGTLNDLLGDDLGKEELDLLFDFNNDFSIPDGPGMMVSGGGAVERLERERSCSPDFNEDRSDSAVKRLEKKRSASDNSERSK